MPAMSFPSAVGYEVEFLMMPRIGKKKQNSSSFSACHLSSQMICGFSSEREVSCWLFLNIAVEVQTYFMLLVVTFFKFFTDTLHLRRMSL